MKIDVTNVTKFLAFEKCVFEIVKYIYIAHWLHGYLVTNRKSLVPQWFSPFWHPVTKCR